MNEGLHLLQPGIKLDNDWADFPIPNNIEVGTNTFIDTSFCFEKFFSKKPVGMKIGSHVTILKTNLATEANGYLEIGDYSYISSACLIANEKIVIGKYAFIGKGVTIVDTDFHPMDPGNRLLDTIAISPAGDKSKRPSFQSQPVIIGDDVWIGFNATILKGVTIGAGSIIQPGSVVLRSIPPGSIVEGNPAQILKSIS